MPAVTTGAAEIGGAGAVGGASAVPASYSLASGAGAGGGLSTAGVNIAPGLGSAGAGASKGLLASAMASPSAAPALITGGTQLIGGVMQGYGARQEQKRQEQMTEDQKAAYNRNIGTRLWG
jgi:hypothetical protein